MPNNTDVETKPVEHDYEHQLYCVICDKPLLDDNGEGHIAEIRRGYCKYPDDRSDNGGVYCENMKLSLHICIECFLNNIDVCRFMNAIGYRIR